MTDPIAPQPAAPRRLGRSILAILVGFIVVVFLSLGTDQAMRVVRVFPPLGVALTNPLFVLATFYRAVYGILGGFITARIAPHSPMDHAIIGGAIGFVLSALGAITTWNHSGFGPHWYPLALIVITLPCAWLGGKLAGTRSSD